MVWGGNYNRINIFAIQNLAEIAHYVGLTAGGLFGPQGVRFVHVGHGGHPNVWESFEDIQEAGSHASHANEAQGDRVIGPQNP